MPEGARGPKASRNLSKIFSWFMKISLCKEGGAEIIKTLPSRRKEKLLFGKNSLRVWKIFLLSSGEVRRRAENLLKKLPKLLKAIKHFSRA